MIMKRPIYLLVLISFFLQSYACTTSNDSFKKEVTNPTPNTKDMKLKIIIGDKILQAKSEYKQQNIRSHGSTK